MAKLQHLIGMCLAGEEAPKSWYYLYAVTAPPKQVLDDLSQSLQQAKLPPAADVYFGANKAPPTEGQVLGLELLALLGSPRSLRAVQRCPVCPTWLSMWPRGSSPGQCCSSCDGCKACRHRQG